MLVALEELLELKSGARWNIATEPDCVARRAGAHGGYWKPHETLSKAGELLGK
jgi:hypothetical protein